MLNTGKSIKIKVKRRVHTCMDENQHKNSAPGRSALTRLSPLAGGLVKLVLMTASSYFTTSLEILSVP